MTVSLKAAPAIDTTLEQLRSMSAQEVAALLGKDLQVWPGKCFEIAYGMVKALNWADATAVYGHFRGKISRKCKLFHGKPLVHHGWILTSEGYVVDPTRWVFEHVEPYIAIFAPGAAELADYDEGGEQWARDKMGPAPAFQATAKIVSLADGKASPELAQAIGGLLGNPRGLTDVSMNQVFWLANLPYTSLGSTAGPLYSWFKNIGVIGFVPVDFLHRAKREGQLQA